MLLAERVPRSPSTVAPEITLQGNRGTLDLDTFILNAISYYLTRVRTNIMSVRKNSSMKKPAKAKNSRWYLKLYVAGQTPRSLAALSNLKKICEEHLAGQYSIQVIDLLKNPQLAKGDQIFALPTLVRNLPQPMKKIIGDLSNTERVLVGLDLQPGE